MVVAEVVAARVVEETGEGVAAREVDMGRGCWSTHSCCCSCSQSLSRSLPPLPTRRTECSPASHICAAPPPTSWR